MNSILSLSSIANKYFQKKNAYPLRLVVSSIVFATLLLLFLSTGIEREIYSSLIVKKWLSLYYFTAITLPLTVILRSYTKDKLRFSKVDGLMFLFMGWVLYGAILKQSLPLFNEQSIKAISLLWVYIIIRIIPIKSETFFIPLFIALAIGAVAQSVWGLGQLYGWFTVYHIIYPVTGSFFNPAPLSCFLAIGLVSLATLYLFHSVKGFMGQIVEWILFFGILIVISTLPATYSRAGWIAAGVGVLPVVWFRYGFWGIITKYTTHKWWLRNMKIVLPLVAFAIFIGIVALKSGSALGRITIWKSSGLMFLDHPFTGVGMGGWLRHYGDYQSQYFASGLGSATEKLMAGNVQYSYNEAVTLLCETGLIGTILFFGMLYFLLRPQIINLLYGEKNSDNAFKIGFLGMVFAYLTFAMFSFPFSDAVNTTLFFVALGSMGHDDFNKELKNN